MICNPISHLLLQCVNTSSVIVHPQTSRSFVCSSAGLRQGQGHQLAWWRCCHGLTPPVSSLPHCLNLVAKWRWAGRARPQARRCLNSLAILGLLTYPTNEYMILLSVCHHIFIFLSMIKQNVTLFKLITCFILLSFIIIII